MAAAPLVVVCVADDEAVHQLLDPLEGALAGRTLVHLTTGTSAQARANAAWAEERGAAFLDGAVMAVPEDIATDDAVLLYSGPRDAFAPHEPVLRALSPAGTTYLDGDPGLAALHDLALLGIMWGVLNGFLHGAALLGTAGVRAESFAPLAARMTTVVAGYVTAAAHEVDTGSYPAGDATLTVHQEAMRHLAEESEALGVNAELPRFLQRLTDRAVADGHAESGYAALVEQFRKPQGVLSPDGTGEGVGAPDSPVSPLSSWPSPSSSPSP